MNQNNKKFQILFLSLPRVVYDRNLHDRCTDFGETAQYVINQYQSNPNVCVDIIDGSIPGLSLRGIYRIISNQQHDLVVLYTDVPDAPLAMKLAKILRYISPNTRTIVYGDSALTVPQYFLREPFDAVHIEGDQEYAIYSYSNYLLTGNKDVLSGVAVRFGDSFEKFKNEVRIPSEEWAFPPLERLPIEDYRKFSLEYKKSPYACSIYVSKGCPKRCQYCLCGSREGYNERRRPIVPLVDFLEKNRENFDVFKMHSADFMLDKAWVKDFCEEIIKRGLKINWKTTVCFDSIDEELLDLVSKAGCYSLGFGVETFFRDKENGMKLTVKDFEDKMKIYSKYPIRFKGFVMMGVRNQTIEDIEYTIDLLRQNNVKVRPSTYTPFYLLYKMTPEQLDEVNLEAWNKKECFQAVNKNITEEDIYRIFLDCKF